MKQIKRIAILGTENSHAQAFTNLIRTCPELTLIGKTISGNTLKPLQSWAIVGVMYMIVIITLSKLAKRIERRVNRGR